MAQTTLAPAAAPSDDKRWRQVDVRMRRLGYRPDGLIEVLHTTQEVFGYFDDDALAYVGESLGVPPSKVYGVATFYSHFTLKPQGEHTCVVCTGTACYINGAAALLDEIVRYARGRGGCHYARREGVCAQGPLPGRLQPGPGGRDRRRGPRQGDACRVEDLVGGVVSAGGETGADVRAAGEGGAAQRRRRQQEPLIPAGRGASLGQYLPGRRVPVDGFGPALRRRPGRGGSRRAWRTWP